MSNLSSKYQKDYKNVTFNNPKIFKEKQQKKRHLTVILFICGMMLILGLSLFVIFTPKLQVKNITIEGINKISQEKFEKIVNDYRNEKIIFVIPRNNILFFSQQGLKKKIGTSYLLENISIEKKFPNEILIKLEEKQAKIVWLTNNKCFHLDQEGMAIEYCDENTQNFIRIKNSTTTDCDVGKQAVTSDWIDYLIETQQLLSEKINSKLFEIDPSQPNSIKIQTDKNFDIYLNKNLNAAEQVNRLWVLLDSEEVKQKLPTLKYIDLRFGEKIYYQ